jgi:hypothetical protein
MLYISLELYSISIVKTETYGLLQSFYSILEEQGKIADVDNASGVSPNICDDKRGFAKYV